MSEEIVENIIEEVIEQPIENIEQNDQSIEQTENEGQEKIEEKPVHKPWEKKKEVSENVPYSRFKEINDERRELERKLSEYEQRVRTYEESQVKVKDIQTLDELTAKFDNNEINSAEYHNTLLRLAKQEFQKEQDEKARIAEQKKFEDDLNTNFVKKIESASKTNPEVVEAVNYITENFAQHLRPETRYALLTDDNAGEVIYEIATNQELLEFVLKANPIDVARKIAKLSSKYDNKTVPEKPMPKVEAMVPKQTTAKTPNIGSKPSPSTRYRDDMSMSEYRKWRGK